MMARLAMVSYTNHTWPIIGVRNQRLLSIDFRGDITQSRRFKD